MVHTFNPVSQDAKASKLKASLIYIASSRVMELPPKQNKNRKPSYKHNVSKVKTCGK